MNKKLVEKEFETSIENKFNVYNSLFLNLPFHKVQNIGMFIPLLHHVCKTGLEGGKDPIDILDTFFASQANISSDEEKIDFMFRVIQYVERQIVLYDSVEDAAYTHMHGLTGDLSLKDFIHLLENRSHGEKISEVLSNFSARIVFTAHPTQFYPPSVLEIISRLRKLISDNRINEIDLTLQQLGLTPLTNIEKPTPFDEAKNVLYFFKEVYYDALGVLYKNICKTMPGDGFNNHDIVQLGFWPGGDRDGNPFVTAGVTMQVADELRMALMQCYLRDIDKLQLKLTFRQVDQILKELRQAIYPTCFQSEKTISLEAILTPLQKVRTILIDKYNSLYLNDLDDFINKVKIFRTQFASLDIRQNHTVHLKIITETLRQKKIIKTDLSELKPSKLIDILLNANYVLEPELFDDSLIQDTIRNIKQLKTIQAKNGEHGCNRYIVSNSEDIFSVLFVFALFRWCGMDTKEIKFDIIPLFESMSGMTNAKDIMLDLLRLPAYRAHIKQRKETQTMMLGFSDGTKDGGYLKANWAIFRTKEELSTVCEMYGVKAIFFDGRGGPPARGGGKTHRFYAAQSEKIANHAIQLTIQGQTITSKFGTIEHFTHNSEQLLTAGLAHKLTSGNNTISAKQRSLIEELAERSFEKYTSLKNHPKFIPYLENKSTLKYYSRTNIGSRPSKRGNKDGLDLKDLRAIPFVGSWSQLKQNVPGYYGIGTAIADMIKKGMLEQLKQLFAEVPFFKALILNSMMSLSKCYFELTAYITKDPEYKEFWNLLFDEYKLAKDMVLLISGYERLMQEEPISRNSIQIRERIVLPLLVIQQYALQKIEKKSKKSELFEKMVKRSLYGNINASRNAA